MGNLDTVIQYTDSTANLASGASFIGTARDTGNNSSAGGGYSRFRVLANSDQPGTISVDQSPDNVTWYTTKSQGAVTNNPTVIESIVTLRYVRVNFKNNGGSTTTVLRIASALVSI